MNEHDLGDIERRLNRLEQEMALLRGIPAGREEKPPHPVRFPPAPPSQNFVSNVPPVQAAEPAPWQTSEFWLGRIGIGLTLLAIVFFFDYAIDRGWLTPWTRVGTGVCAGLALTFFGIRWRESRSHLSSLMQGGALVAFYICGYAAFQMYGLVSHLVALAWMSVLTVLALAWSVKSREVTVSLIAAAGGMATPSLLYSGDGSAAGLMLYLSVLMAGCLAVFLYRGWRSLFVVLLAGCWVVLIQGVRLSDLQGNDVGIVLAAILLIGWLGLWLAGVVRELAEQAGALDEPGLESLPEWFRDAAAQLQPFIVRFSVPVIATVSAVVVFEHLDLSEQNMGWFLSGAFAVYSAAYYLLRAQKKETSFTALHGTIAVAALTGALACLLESDLMRVALAAEAVVVHLVSRRLGDRALKISAHMVSALAVGGLLYSLLAVSPAADSTAVFNASALAELAVIAILVAISFLPHEDDSIPLFYRLAAHVGLLAWLACELGRLPGGDGWVSASWGLYSLALLIPGLLKGNQGLRATGLATLLLTAAKLMIVDLARVDSLWRILLFLAFGVIFLSLGYWLRNLWQFSDPEGGEHINFK